MALNVIVSNSSRQLAAHFRDEVYRKRQLDESNGLGELFRKEVVVVQAQGMSVWLNQQLADPTTPVMTAFSARLPRTRMPPTTP